MKEQRVVFLVARANRNSAEMVGNDQDILKLKRFSMKKKEQNLDCNISSILRQLLLLERRLAMHESLEMKQNESINKDVAKSYISRLPKSALKMPCSSVTICFVNKIL